MLDLGRRSRGTMVVLVRKSSFLWPAVMRIKKLQTIDKEDLQGWHEPFDHENHRKNTFFQKSDLFDSLWWNLQGELYFKYWKSSIFGGLKLQNEHLVKILNCKKLWGGLLFFFHIVGPPKISKIDFLYYHIVAQMMLFLW